MKKRPNIFDYATSELSQDAFLTWLIQWADNDYQEIDSHLNNFAVSFVKEILGKDRSFKIEKVEAGRQWNNIDVWAMVNYKYFIVIEDKKGTQVHSDQLNRYSEIAKKHYAKTDIEIRLVYFKMEEQGKYSDIEKAGFTPFKRSKMLSLLENYINSTELSNQNDIIVDYYKNLDNLENKIKSYLTNPLNEWHWYSWQGFYSELQKHIGGNWEYVSNAAGGFLGFWWNINHSTIDGKEFKYYLQLEQNKFVFKLYAFKENERREVRDFYRKHLFKKAKELNIDISKFGRIGAYMGVAKLNSEYRMTNNEYSLLDFQATVENLKGLMKLINETKEEINKYI